MNMQMLMQQANKMKKDMEKAQEEVNNMTFTSKQDLVEITINGNKEVIKVEIDKNIDKDDIEVLQDMILLAFNDACKQATKAMDNKLGKFNIPGMPGMF